jgi:hypothetical protein
MEFRVGASTDIGGHVVSAAVHPAEKPAEGDAELTTPSLQEYDEKLIRRIPTVVEPAAGSDIVAAGHVRGTDIHLLVYEGRPPGGEWTICRLVAQLSTPGANIGCSPPGEPGLTAGYGGSWPDNLSWGPVDADAVLVVLTIDGGPTLRQTPVARHALFVTPMGKGTKVRLQALSVTGRVLNETEFDIP